MQSAWAQSFPEMSNRLREIDNKLTIVGLISKIFEGVQLPKRLLILMPSFSSFRCSTVSSLAIETGARCYFCAISYSHGKSL